MIFTNLLSLCFSSFFIIMWSINLHIASNTTKEIVWVKKKPQNKTKQTLAPTVMKWIVFQSNLPQTKSFFFFFAKLDSYHLLPDIHTSTTSAFIFPRPAALHTPVFVVVVVLRVWAWAHLLNDQLLRVVGCGVLCACGRTWPWKYAVIVIYGFRIFLLGKKK